MVSLPLLCISTTTHVQRGHNKRRFGQINEVGVANTLVGVAISDVFQDAPPLLLGIKHRSDGPSHGKKALFLLIFHLDKISLVCSDRGLEATNHPVRLAWPICKRIFTPIEDRVRDASDTHVPTKRVSISR